MPIQVIMPQLGESVVEGTVTKWLKMKGERVEEYEPLLEINTDKVDSEIPSPATGIILDILVPEGSTVPAGTLLAWIGDLEGAATDRERPLDRPEAAAPSQGTAIPEQPQSGGQKRELGFISPVVARIADQNQVDLFQVAGTGQGGRITKNDVLAFIERRDKTKGEPTTQTTAKIPSPPTTTTTAAVSPTLGQPALDQVSGKEKIVPFTPVRRAIAEHMVLSKHTSLTLQPSWKQI